MQNTKTPIFGLVHFDASFLPNCCFNFDHEHQGSKAAIGCLHNKCKVIFWQADQMTHTSGVGGAVFKSANRWTLDTSDVG